MSTQSPGFARLTAREIDRIPLPGPHGTVRLQTLKTRGRRAASLPEARRSRELASRTVDLVMARVRTAARGGSTREWPRRVFSRFFSHWLPSCPARRRHRARLISPYDGSACAWLSDAKEDVMTTEPAKDSRRAVRGAVTCRRHASP